MVTVPVVIDASSAAHSSMRPSAPDPEQRRTEAFGLHDLIDPRDTRPLTVDFVRTAHTVVPTTLAPKTRSMRP